MLGNIYKFTALFFTLTTIGLLLMCGYTKNKITRLESEKTALKIEVKSCNDSIKEFNDAQIRAGNTIEKVREVVRTVKSDCDCYNSAVDKRILDRVRKR